MVTTRDQWQAALDHVINVVLAQGPPGDTIISDALTAYGVASPLDLLTVPPEDLATITYKDAAGTSQPLPKFKVGLLNCFRYFCDWKVHNGEQIKDDEWIKLTPADFNTYRGSRDSTLRVQNLMTVTSVATGGNQHTPLNEFRKGSKCDPTLFPYLKDSKSWDSWHRAMQAQARTQQVSEILDVNARPPLGSAAEDLFQEKQKYLYAVFERTLLHNQGKALVRKYEKTYDAHALYQELLTYHTKSTSAAMESSKIFAYVTSVKVGDGQFKGGMEAFILHWQEQVRQYESLVDITDSLSDTQKRTMLENAVHPIEELRIIKTQATQLAIHNGKLLTFDQYSDLLVGAAQSCDRLYADHGQQQRNPGTPRIRRIMEHDVSYDNDMDIFTPDAAFYDAFALEQRQRTRLPNDAWQRLDAQGRQSWTSLSEDVRAIILDARSGPRRGGYTTPPLGNASPSGRRFPQASSHAPSPRPNNMTANEHHIAADQDCDTPAHDGPHDYELPPALHAHLSKRGDVRHPAEPTRMMGNTPPSVTTTPSEITIDGRLYRSINVAVTTYGVSSSRIIRDGALIDRGANGGIAGEDVRVLSTTNKMVNVRGIDNHEVCDIPLVTCAGVMQTQQGEVIAIMHNYAYTGRGRTIHSSAQLECYKNDVNDKSTKVNGGMQRITTLDGYIIPIHIRHGLPYVTL